MKRVLKKEKKSGKSTFMEQTYALVNAIYSTGGELTEVVESQITEMSPSIDGLSFLMKRLEAEKVIWREDANVRAKIAQGYDKARERVRDLIKHGMTVLQTNELVGNEARFLLYENGKKLTMSENKIPEQYFIIETIKRVDTERLIKDLKAGVEVPGAALVPVLCLKESINKKGIGET